MQHLDVRRHPVGLRPRQLHGQQITQPQDGHEDLLAARLARPQVGHRHRQPNVAIEDAPGGHARLPPHVPKRRDAIIANLT